ncbi:MAG: hypothetical protein ABSG17_19440 [Spirochaetia bacterium]|jgi:hypothetical protein
MKEFHGCLQASVALFTAIAFGGCASIMSGGEQKVTISSLPSEARVKISTLEGAVVFDSKTPSVAVLKRGSGWFRGATYRVRIEKPGYKGQTIILSSNLNAGWYLLGNLLIGGLIGWLIVDPATGAMYTLSSDNVNVQLASETSFLQQKEGLMIVLLKDVPAAVLPQLQKVALPD